MKENKNNIKKPKLHLSLNSDLTIFQQLGLYAKLLYQSSSHYQKKLELERERKRSIERFSPDPEQGLSDAQVELRKEQKLTNKTPTKSTKSIPHIIFSNVFTYFNILMFVIAIVLMSFHKFGDLFFILIIVTNIVVGIVQEIRSKKIIDKLRLIVSPKCIVVRNGVEQEIDESDVVLDDIALYKVGNQIGSDGCVVEGEMEVNESALTGESLPIRKVVGDKVLSGSFVVSGRCKVRVNKVGLDTFSGKLQKQAKSVNKNTSKLRRSINAFIGIVSILIVPFVILSIITNSSLGFGIEDTVAKTCAQAIGMIPSGLILLVSAALCVGVIILSRHNTLVQDLYSIERLARVDVLCLDKTGTLTDGSMEVTSDLICDKEIDFRGLLSSYLGAFEDNNATSLAMIEQYGRRGVFSVANKLEFSSSRKYSAVEFNEIGTFALGAYEFLIDEKKMTSEQVNFIEKNTSLGNRILSIVRFKEKLDKDKKLSNGELIGLIALSDHIRDEAKATIKWFNDNNVKCVIISGDNPQTVSTIANRCGVADADKFVSLEGKSEEEVRELALTCTVFGRVLPEQKAIIVQTLKDQGHSVAMTGDGINDILAMKRSDCAIAMNNGTDATKAIAHLVLLDSNFANMPKVVEEGRRVVNNVQLSASLYIMKTIFTALLTITLFVCTLLGHKMTYPFEPRMMMILEICIIGMPSFFLALQPNNKIIKGNFISNVIYAALPAAGAMFAGTLSFMLFAEANSINGISATTSEGAVLLFIGSLQLMLLCLPFNLYRSIVFVVSIAIAWLFFFLLPNKMIGFYPELWVSSDYINMLYCILIGIGFGVIIKLALYLLKKFVFQRKTD